MKIIEYNIIKYIYMRKSLTLFSVGLLATSALAIDSIFSVFKV